MQVLSLTTFNRGSNPAVVKHLEPFFSLVRKVIFRSQDGLFNRNYSELVRMLANKQRPKKPTFVENDCS